MLKTGRLYIGATLCAKLSVGVIWYFTMIRYITVLVLFATARAMPTLDKESNEIGFFGPMLGVVKECVDGDTSLCIKVGICEVMWSAVLLRSKIYIDIFWLQEKTLKYVEAVNTARELNVADGVSILSNGSPRSARALEPLPEEPKAREAQVESRLVDSAADFLENHVIQFKMPSSAIEGMKRSLEEGELS